MRVEFYFDFSCPYAYLASERIVGIADRAGAEFIWRPMLLGGVFNAIHRDGAPMATMNPAKAQHNLWDMHRWAERDDIPLIMPAGHPMRTVRALRALLAAPEASWTAIIHAFYRAYWRQGRDLSDPEVVAAILSEAGLSRDAVERAVNANDDPAIKAELRRRTDEAIVRGVFGAPAIFVQAPGRDEAWMFWGQDRLHMVEAALRGWIPGQPADPEADADGTSPRDLVAAPPAPAPSERPAPATVHFWYDFSSPFAYLASTQIAALAARTGAHLRWRPMLLGGLFRELGTDNVPLFAMPRSKRAYIERDMHHWASFCGVPFAFPKHFPQKTVTALRLALVAGDRIADLSHALFRAMWVDGADLEDSATLSAVLSDHGFDAEHLLARTREPAVKQQLIANTSEALRAGVFGAPTCIVAREPDTRLFWGQDRLDLVEDTLRGWWPTHG